MSNKPFYHESQFHQEELNRSNKFQALLDCAEIIFIEIDREGIVILVNKKACKVLGYSESEILGKNWFENFLPERVKNEILPISEKLLSGEIEGAEFYENPILTKNNEERIIYWHNTYIRDNEGEIISYLSSGEDITERKKTENLLKESEEKFRIVSEFTHDWEYWIDIRNEFIYVSPSCKRITGYEPKDFYADKLLLKKIIHPDDLEIYSQHKHSINADGNRIPLDFRIITRNKETEWIAHVCQNVFDKNGKLMGIRGSNRLITDQKKQELRNKMLSNIIEQSPACIVVTNIEGEIAYVNNSFTDITGYSFNEAIGKNPRILNSGKNNPTIFADLWETITQGKVWKGEFINKGKSGEYYYEKAIISPTMDKNGKIVNYFAIKEDITLQKKAELLLQESENNLKISNATKDKLLSIIAHDLRSPFNAILGLSNLLLENHCNYEVQEREKIIKLIKKSSESTFDLLENLLKWSITQTGGIQFNPNQYILERIIKKSIEQAEGIAKYKNIKVTYNVENTIVVRADESMLNIILRNLISNAIKFTSESGEIKVIATKSHKNIIVSVKDNGVGIKKEKLKNIFKVLGGETSIGTSNEIGHGLGLALCKEFVNKHGGEIFVESEEGVGSSFSFTIPMNTES